MMKLKTAIGAVAIWLLLLQMGCTEQESLCSSAISQNISLSFFKRFKTVIDGRDTTLFADSLMYIKQVAISGTQELFLQGDSSANFNSLLPLNPLTDTTLFAITTAINPNKEPVDDNTTSFTIGLAYTRSQQVVSAECGIKTNFDNFILLGVEGASYPFDSIALKTLAGDNVLLEFYYDTLIVIDGE